MDYAKINEAAMGYKDDMTKFLRDLVRIPGESCGEKGHIMRIKEEMEKVGFDKVQIDPMGNILGYMGTGKTLIGFDAHIDTVGIGTVTVSAGSTSSMKMVFVLNSLFPQNQQTAVSTEDSVDVWKSA